MKIKCLVIIDTEEYAGNFERQLCAYITGKIGECGVGEKEADIFKEEVDIETVEWFEDNVKYIQDDNGAYRPAGLSPTPGWFNDGAGNFYKENEYDPQIVISKYNESMEKYGSSFKHIISIDEINKHPAYMSIEIEFQRAPDFLMDLIVQRAHSFCKDDRSNCFRPENIKTVRLVERITTDIELFRK